MPQRYNLSGTFTYGNRCTVGNNGGGLPTHTKAGVYGYPSSRQETVFIPDYLLQSWENKWLKKIMSLIQVFI
jgi:hypothetical protein